MICVDYNCIFVHIPKTAGQSIEHFFLNRLGLNWDQRDRLLLRPNTDSKLGPEKLAHLTASEYVSCGHLRREQFSSFYKFSFVRNPWERLVSEYHFHGYSNKYSFKEFLLHGLPKPGMTDVYRHILPQYDFLYDARGNRLVDFVGRFENLQSDFDKISMHLKIDGSKLPHINASNSSDGAKKNFITKLLARTPRKKRYTDYYDSECLSFVSEMYQKDIQAFEYTFGE